MVANNFRKKSDDLRELGTDLRMCLLDDNAIRCSSRIVKVWWGRMAGETSRWRMWRAQPIWLRVTVLVSVALLSTGCATRSYMGISLVPGQAPTELQRTAALARFGDKMAQYELGLRFEEGRDVPVDYQAARLLFSQAATSRPNLTQLYIPDNSRKYGGYTSAVDNKLPQPGIPQAVEHLKRLTAREK